MDDYIRLYLEKLKNKKLSSSTILAYRNDIVRFEDFIASKGEVVTKVSNLSVVEYVQFLKSNSMKDATIARNLVSLRRFYKFLSESLVISKNPISEYSSPKISHTISEILTTDETERLLNIPNVTTVKGIRDKAMLELMYASGIKVTELISLKLKDLNLELNYIVCVGFKNKERVIPINKTAVNSLKEYIKVRHELSEDKNDYLFLNTKGEELSRQGFWKILNVYVDAAKINKNITPTTIRHSFAVHLIQNGADLKTVQELLGYSDLNMMEIYYSVVNKNKIFEVYNRAHPRA